MSLDSVYFYLSPLIGALIGWLTNYIAVKMLFHPRRARRFLGIRLQGVFPRRQREFAERLGLLVSSQLISVSDVTRKLGEKALSDETLGRITHLMEEAAYQRLLEEVPLAAVFTRRRWFGRLGRAFKPDLEKLLRSAIRQVNAELEGEIDIQHIVESRVAQFSTDKLEEMILAVMRRELRIVEIMGGVLGFLIGMLHLALYRLAPGG